MAAEVVGGLLTGSLALLADAAHMVTDAGGLALSCSPSTTRPRRRRGQELRLHALRDPGGPRHAVVLLGVTAYILYEAYRRFFEPTEILGWR